MSDYLTNLQAKRAALNERAVNAPAARIPFVCPRCYSPDVSWVGGAKQTPICNPCHTFPPVIALPVTEVIADLDRLIAWAKSCEVPS